jgi:acetyl-CoA carboxylase biotin carboxylase subunit
MKRVLIANRGEIALRVIRACHEEGLEAVAVCSDADRSAPHVRAADRVEHIGPSVAAESYLNIPRLLEAAARSGADAVHPGYGFLSERAPFAEAVEQAGLVWIGPPPHAIRAMGDKTEARRRMKAAGVPVVPGAMAAVVDLKAARAVAEDIGFPLMVKASAGGGGRGMRVVRAPGELRAALEASANEAEKAFGDASVYLEKYVERPRHIEMQVLADRERVVHVGERECSVQRRHQKLVEEAPSIAVTPELREWMGAAAVSAAAAVEYRGAGTCEFLLSTTGTFYFLEMNTRIQVEHPVTEMVYGVDLVREQLRIAQGMPMSVPATYLHPRGWAIECRIASEDPRSGFLPSTGRITYLRAPGGPGVRWDSGVDVGSEVTLHYDSLLAKLIVWAPNRADAIARMGRALDELMIVGVATNVSFHQRLMADEAFRQGDVDIQLLERRPELFEPVDDTLRARQVAVLVARAEDEGLGSRAAQHPGLLAGEGSRWAAAARRDALR